MISYVKILSLLKNYHIYLRLLRNKFYSIYMLERNNIGYKMFCICVLVRAVRMVDYLVKVRILYCPKKNKGLHPIDSTFTVQIHFCRGALSPNGFN